MHDAAHCPVNDDAWSAGAVPDDLSARLDRWCPARDETALDSRALPENAIPVSCRRADLRRQRLPTGVHPSELLVFQLPAVEHRRSDAESGLVPESNQASPFRCRVDTMTALDRFYPQSDGSVVLAKRTGSTLLMVRRDGHTRGGEFRSGPRSHGQRVNAHVGRRFDVRAAARRPLNTANSGARDDPSTRHLSERAQPRHLPALGRWMCRPRSSDDRIDGDGSAGTGAIRAREDRPGNSGILAATGRCCFGTLPAPFIGDLTADVTPEASRRC